MSDTVTPIEEHLRRRVASATKDEKRLLIHETWFAAAKALRGWPAGKEVTEAEYQAAVTDAQGVEIR